MIDKEQFRGGKIKTDIISLNAEFSQQLGQYPCTMSCFIQDAPALKKTSVKRPAVIIFPGGAYQHISSREGEPIALNFCGYGYNAFIVNYSVAENSEAKYPVQLMQAAAAVIYIKKHAKELNTDPERISVCGFSAGGHLAALLGCMHDSREVKEAFGKKADARPYKMILSYALLTTGKYANKACYDNLFGKTSELREIFSLDKYVSAATPPAFLWHTAGDQTVKAQNSLLFAAALAENGIPYELHVFPGNVHGIALGTEVTSKGSASNIDAYAARWFKMALHFLEE